MVRLAAIGAWRTPSQTARKATPCASPDGPDTITAEALLALASWLDQRDEHGGNPCSPTNRPTPPPVPTAGTSDGDLGPTPDGSPATAPAAPRRTARPSRHRRSGPAAGGAS